MVAIKMSFARFTVQEPSVFDDQEFDDNGEIISYTIFWYSNLNKYLL